jgi:hypothetical protein
MNKKQKNLLIIERSHVMNKKLYETPKNTPLMQILIKREVLKNICLAHHGNWPLDKINLKLKILLRLVRLKIIL